MNLKTTLLLLFLLIAGAAGFYLYWVMQPPEVVSETTTFLNDKLKPGPLTYIEIKRDGRQVVLKRLGGQEWTLPGNWSVRQPEVAELVKTLTTLHSRFAPIPLTHTAKLREYGLDKPALVVVVKLDGKEHTLELGENAGASNRFSQPTFLRLDQKPEVVRLAPGLIAALDRPQDHYQQRRLFPTERMVREENPKEKVEQVVAEAITVKDGKDLRYAIVKKGDDWELSEPARDRLDPDKLKTILTALPDLWAEKFVETKGKKLEDFGLKDPEQVLVVTRRGGDKVILLVGKESPSTKEKVVSKPAPPFGQPRPPIKEVVKEEYRYAKLQADNKDNDQVFEIKADKLKDLVVAADTLRDERLARFKAEDVRRLEVQHDGKTLLAVKDKDGWRLEKPHAEKAESGPINDLLDKLADLRAKDKDIQDKTDPKTQGLDKPAIVKVTVEETRADKEKKTREFTFLLGKKDEKEKKLYVQVEGWPRVNAVDDAIAKLVERPALAYRSRRLLDVPAGDLAKIEIQRGKETYTLEKPKGEWKLTAPVSVDVDLAKAIRLVDELSKLEAVEFIAPEPKAEDLDKTYGLLKPALSAKVVFAGDKKPPQTLLVGKQREGKQEYYARLESNPGVFVIKKETFEALDKDSLDFRKTQLWKVPEDDIAEIQIDKSGARYLLKRDGLSWRIEEPFQAKATLDTVEKMVDELSNLQSERFVSHGAADLVPGGKDDASPYGLDKPYLRVAVIADGKKKDAAKPKEKGPDPTRHDLVIGNLVSDKDKSRYARVIGHQAVFVLSGKILAALDHGALDLLNRNLLALDTGAIQRVRVTGPDPFTLLKQKDDWQVADSSAPSFTAESEAVEGTLKPWARLRAERFAAYGEKDKLATFGLDKPERSVTVTLEADKDKKPTEHTLVLGKTVDNGNGARYAQLDKGEGVFILDPATVAALTRTHLDFVNPLVLKYDLDAINTIQRKMNADDMELLKKDDAWRIVKPGDHTADVLIVEGILDRTFRLRAKRIAAYPAKDLAPFGLAMPAAVVTLKGETAGHTLKIGKAVEGADVADRSADRYAVVDSTTTVFVLPGDLAKRLLAPALDFRDHNLASFSSADRIELDRGNRKVVFTKTDGVWKLTAPIAAEAEDADLEELIRNLVRLRADELVAEKPGNSKAFGLDPPQARWQFFAGDKKVLDLEIGSPDANSKDARHYAKLAGSDLVFLLRPQTSTKALAEYRSRKVWPPLDAVQVEEVTFAYPQNPFTLKKIGDGWQIAGKPEVKVDAKAVSDTLDALARLQAERYVADARADLKLFGLDPPTLTVEIRTPAGKRTLLIGRGEGGTQRHYAAVPGPEPAVFILSDAEGRRIVRNVAAFVEPEQNKKVP